MSSSNQIEEDPYSVALTIALGAIGRRSLSKKQLADHLLKRGTPPEVLEQTVMRLEEMGYLNDLDFARATSERMRRVKKASRRAIIDELRTKSIDQEIIDWVLEDISQESDLELAKDFAERKWRNGSDLDPEKLRKRITGALLRKGFSTSVSLQVVKSLR